MKSVLWKYTSNWIYHMNWYCIQSLSITCLIFIISCANTHSVRATGMDTRNYSQLSWELTSQQQFKAVLDKQDCDNCTCLMLIRKRGRSVIWYDNDINLGKMSSSVTASAFSSNSCSSSKSITRCLWGTFTWGTSLPSATSWVWH